MYEFSEGLRLVVMLRHMQTLIFTEVLALKLSPCQYVKLFAFLDRTSIIYEII